LFTITTPGIVGTAHRDGKLMVRPKTTNSNDDIYQVHVLLKEGGNLVAKDFSGSSDPYVKFKYKGKQVHKTKIVYQNLNPSWGERFVFVAAGLQTPLVIQVYDYDRFASDDFMGSANLYLKPLKLNTAYELKVLLTDNTSDLSMGYLLLQIMVSPFTEDDVHNINYRPPLINSEYFKKPSNSVSEWLSVLHISLIEGRGFCPISTVQGINLPDLYVRFKLETEKAKSRVSRRMELAYYICFKKYSFFWWQQKHSNQNGKKVLICTFLRQSDIKNWNFLFMIVVKKFSLEKVASI
ncbi:Multiple C2 and transmembrane domain-containing protein 1, partial [Trichinella sp. T9]